MVETNNDSNKNLRRISLKALKATIKGVLVFAVYYIIWMFIAPIFQMIPGLQLMIETFVAVYIIFIILEELTSGTIYNSFFNIAKALFVIGYLISAFNGGIFSITYQNINLIVDLRLVLEIAVVLSLLGLAKSVFQTINFMSEKAEYARI
jgi:hypothetical protein